MTPEHAAMDLQGLACKMEAREIGIWIFYNEALKIIHAQRAEAVAEANKWQPMETAPRDGSKVLIWSKNTNRCFVAWFTHQGHWIFLKTLDDEPFVLESVSHWMPLPAPPEQEGEG